MNNLASYSKKLLHSKLIKDAGIYTLFNVLDRSIPFLLLPLITRYLNPSEYGIYVTFQVIVSLVLPFITNNTDAAILRNYFNRAKIDFENYFSNGFIIFFIFSSLTIIIFGIFSSSLSGFFGFPEKWLFAIILACIFQFLSDLKLNFWQVKKEPKKYGIYKISLTLFKNGLIVLLVVICKLKWDGIIIGQLISMGIFAIISISLFYREKIFKWKYNSSYFLDNVLYGAPLTLHILGYWLVDLASRIVLNKMVGFAATGVYSAGASISLIIYLLQDSFNKAYCPYLYDKLNENNTLNNAKFVKNTYYFSIIIIISAIVLGIIGYFAAEIILGKKYKFSGNLIIWQALGYAFNGIYKMHVNYLFYFNKTYLIFIITLIAGIINLCLCIFFVNAFNTIGAAYAMVLGQFSSIIIAWYLGNKIFPLPWFRIWK